MSIWSKQVPKNMPELKLLIVFRKSEIDIGFVKKEAKKFFLEYHDKKDISCSVSIADERNIDSDLIYKADLYEIEATLNYKNPKFYPGHEFKSIGEDWCDNNKNSLSHLWLRLYDRSILTVKAKQFHSDVDIREIAFGTAPTMQHFMQHYHYETKSSDREIMGTFLHNQRKFIVYTCFTHSDKRCRYLGQTHKFLVDYKALSRVLINIDPSKDVMQLYFFTKHLPFIFKEKKKPQNEKNDETKNSNQAQFLASDQEYQEKSWERSLGFGCKCNRSYCAITKVGRCPVFKIVILKTRGFGIIERLIQRCASNTYFFFSNFDNMHIEKHIENFDIFPHNEEFLQTINDLNKRLDTQFLCQYAWKVLLGRSCEVEDQMILKQILSRSLINSNSWEFIKKDIQKAVRHTDALVQTLYHISDMIMRHDIFVFEEAFQKLFYFYRRNIQKIELPDGMCLVRRLIIMPSRIICLQPTEHFDNRVIRKFGSEHFLRVSIQDDNFSKLTFAVQFHTQKDMFMKFIKDILNEGIQIGPRKYKVLAASNSQLREHGLWMFATDHEGNTTKLIREWMGNFNHIRSVAKYMARLGQCFSTSEEAVQVEIKDEEVFSLEDLKNEEYVFSDGVGMISTEIANEVREALNKRVPMNIIEEMPSYEPSAFQIRFKGCKGMVAENPDLVGRQLVKRPSMEKFECESSSMLEIVKISAPRALFLNRPLISLLEQLGIPAKVFMKLLKEMIFDMTDSLIYERKAHKMLANRTGLDFPYKKLLKSGICLTQEPFFRRLLLSVYTVVIDQLRSKTRIAIPPQFGRNMLGVIDETNSLKFGEVFVQYSEELGNNTSPTHVLEQVIVVTKNPCMHPGDVRKLRAVDCPRLHHIKDCIVFPAVGPRPHPDQMAGSDLDGDEYVVIWLEDLIFKKPNYEAMLYPPNKELIHNGPITVSDMVNFLCKYIQNDNVGVMANAYLAWADSHEKGIFSSVCHSIALKYPLALDFAKSGTTEYLTSKEKPKIYPDFMEKGSANNSYKSRRALGLLYRVTRTLEACISKVDLYNESVSCDPNLVYPGWQDYEESAEHYRQEYVKRIKNILKKYGLRNETEALSGYVGKLNEYSENRYERDNALSVAKTFIKDTIKRFRIEFIKSHDIECSRSRLSSSELREKKYRRASAWYVVTYKNHDKSVLSFPWVISDIISEMREKILRSGSASAVPKSSFIQSSDASLLDSFSHILLQNKKLCPCFLILNNIVGIWLSKSSLILTMQQNERFCSKCFERIINTFRERSSNNCCSIGRHDCDCAESCSPTKLLLEFLKFYSSEVVTKIGECEDVNRCHGFRDLNLQSLALQTYATLAVTRNCSTILEDNQQSVGGDDNEEGDPIRVSVSSDFEKIITYHMEEFNNKFKILSGVKEIFINGDKDSRGNWYIFVHSIGKPYQRWALEELMMDSEITNLARSLLNL